MINTPTVFVVGAGASVPYGFPTGGDLLSHAKSSGAAGLWQQIMPKLCGAVLTGDLRDAISACENESVDALLEQRPDILMPGKYFIATRILYHESACPGATNSGGEWLRYLYSRMIEGVSDYREFWNLNKVTFVTFNYDRLIEYKLSSGLQAQFNLNADQVERVLAAAPVIHLHGSAGTLHRSENQVPFAAAWDNVSHYSEKSVVERAANAIKIVHEASGDTPEFKRAHDAMKTAEHAYFLGFGFGVANVKRLNLANLRRSNVSIFLTRLGMTEQEYSMYVRTPFVQAGPIDPIVGSGLSDPSARNWDSLQLLRESVGLLLREKTH